MTLFSSPYAPVPSSRKGSIVREGAAETNNEKNPFGNANLSTTTPCVFNDAWEHCFANKILNSKD